MATAMIATLPAAAQGRRSTEQKARAGIRTDAQTRTTPCWRLAYTRQLLFLDQ